MLWRAAGKHLHDDIRCPQPECEGFQHVAWPDDEAAVTAPPNTNSVTFTHRGYSITCPWRIGQLISERQARRVYDALTDDDGNSGFDKSSPVLVSMPAAAPGALPTFRIMMRREAPVADVQPRRIRVRRGGRTAMDDEG